jgi:amidase
MPESAAAIAAAVRGGTRTARSAVEEALARIDRLDPAIGAFQVVRREHALAEADSMDVRPTRFALPLAGVPIAIKDNVAVKREPMRNGSLASDPAPQTADHEVVRRIRAAGAIVVGLTKVPEMCLYGATDSAFGVTRNPWDTRRTPGGSSGGSAAAVAAGMVPIAHGNDGMGSVRIPAACCGLVGIKPGLGVVPANLGNGSWFDMSENGALGTTVADTALLLSVLADDPSLAEVTEPSALRVAVSITAPMPMTAVAKQLAAPAIHAGGLLASAGHTVRDDSPDYGLSMAPTALARWFAGAELDAQLLADRSRLEKRSRRHTAAGRLVLKAGGPWDGGRNGWLRRASAFFEDHDVLITPALAQLPLRSADWRDRGLLRNLIANSSYAPMAAPWNVAGWPAMVVPMGWHSKGMPTAVQLVTTPGNEARLLAVAAQLERLNPWPRTAPETTS